MVDYYNLLQLAPDAAPEAIRAAYRRAAKRWHPDAHPRLKGPERDPVERHFILIAQAYNTLSDPARRRDYDRRRGAEAASASSAGTKNHKPASGAGAHASRGRADQAKTRSNAAPEPDWNSLLNEVESLLGKFGLDLKQPAERLLETLLDWARTLFDDFLAAWQDDRSATETGAKAGQPRARSEARDAGQTRGNSFADTRRDRTRTPEIEAELAELKRRAAAKKPGGRSEA